MARQREAQSGLAEEFLHAVEELHDEGKDKPYLREIRQRMLADRAARAAEAGVIGKAMQRAGVSLSFRLRQSQLELARISLEERGKLESTMEAQIDHQPPQLLIYLPEDTSAVKSA